MTTTEPTPTPPDWQRGACWGHQDPDIWYPGVGRNATTARSVCLDCPIRQQCLDWAIGTRERHGIWGGHNTPARDNIRRGQPARTPTPTPTTTNRDHHVPISSPCGNGHPAELSYRDGRGKRVCRTCVGDRNRRRPRPDKQPRERPGAGNCRHCHQPYTAPARSYCRPCATTRARGRRNNQAVRAHILHELQQDKDTA